MKYVRICEGITDKGRLIPADESPYNFINPEIDCYKSLYYYNEEHFKEFQSSGTIKGINDVSTDTLIFDFDSDNLEESADDAWELCCRLEEFGIDRKSIQPSFSGGKGFHIEVRTDLIFNPNEFKNVVFGLAKNLKTFDDKIWNASRIIRLNNTKHQKTGLYKIPLSFDELNTLKTNSITTLAKTPRTIELVLKPAHLSSEILKYKDSVEEVELPVDIQTDLLINFQDKPIWMTNCLYALANGYIDKGQRHDAVIRLVAVYKKQGLAVQAILDQIKHILEIRKQRSGHPYDFRELKDDVERFFKDHRGALFTCKTDPWMKRYCVSLGDHGCKNADDGVTLVSVDDMLNEFETFAKNIDQYIVQTGIKSLDERLKLMVGNVLGLLAPPSAGKTSLAIKILNNISKQGFPAIFFSYDMYKNLLSQRLIQRHTKKDMDTLYADFKGNSDEVDRIKKIIKEEYGKVTFSYKTNQTVDDIEKTIINHEFLTGEKVKVIVVDYLELVNGESNDSTQSSMNVAGKLKNLSVNQEVLVILILQPQKVASKPDTAIKSFSAAKGSGMIGQSVSYFLGCHREGLNPDFPGEDNYFTIRCLKNRTGSLFSLDYSWDGITGDIQEIGPTEKVMLEDLRRRKNDDGKDDDGSF